MGCNCGKPKCDGKCGISPAVLQINNPSECVIFHKVDVPASMGDSTTNPPKTGAYKNVLLYYEADQTSWLYSSDGIPVRLTNGITNYEDAINLPQINGETLIGDKSSADLKLADAPMVITIASGNTVWSGADTAEDIYNFFLNQGKVNVVFEGSENYGYEIVSAAYIPGEQKMMCMVAVASVDTGSSPVEFSGNALYGLMTFYTAGKAVDVGELDLQPKLFIADFTGLELNDNILSGVPATNAYIGMVKPSDGLSVSSDGTLTVIDHVFDTVADMKASTELKNGDYARTLGFHTLNDGGGAIYKITDTGTANEMDIIAVGNLYANLVLPDVLDVKQTGAKGDGITDNTAEIQRALDIAKKVYVPSGTYMVDAVTHIDIPSNRKLELSEDAIVKAIANDQGSYSVLRLYDVDNVEISGGTIQGDRDDHIGASGEWGQCISVSNGSTNINIHDIKLIKAWGDGLYINGVTHMRTSNLLVDNARRNGISVVSADDYISTNDTITNTNGTAPQAGVDIEPNVSTDLLRNISFVNTTTKNNTSAGLMVYAMHDNDCSINIINHHDIQSDIGLYIGKSEGTTGYITAENSYYESNVHSGIVFRQCRNSACVVNINEPVILNCNTADSSSPKYGCAISCYAESTDPDYALGNIVVRNPYSTNTNSTQPLLTFSTELTTVNAKIEKVKVFNPINELNNKPIFVRGSAGVDVKLIDEFEAVKVAYGGTLNIAGSQLFSTIVFTGTTDRTVTLADTIIVGGEYTIKNYGTLPYHIKLPDDQYCLQLTNTDGATITLPKTGDEITLRKFDATHWIMVKTNCTPTVA